VRAIPGPRYDGLEARVLDRLDRAGMTDRTTVMAFNPEVASQVRALSGGIRTTLLLERTHFQSAGASADEMLDVAGALGVTDVGLEHTVVDAAFVAATRRRGLALGVWTVDDGATIRRLADLGVDIVTSDRPDVALAAVGTGRPA